jgi:acyl-CoA thioester hydrolase
VPHGRSAGADGVASSCHARLLEEAATVASSEAGYPPEWYEREGTAWVIRRTTIDCGAPLRPGEEVEVATWVGDFRRVRSRREYEVRRPGEAAPALSAHTDWVYVERRSGRPRRISAAMMEAFVPEGCPTALPRDPLVLPSASDAALTVERVVSSMDVDALDHVNNARYFDWVEESTVEGFAAWRAAGDEIAAGARAVRHDLEYVDEAREGDRLRCVVWPVRCEGGEIEIATEIRRAHDGRLLTRARSLWRERSYPGGVSEDAGMLSQRTVEKRSQGRNVPS